MVPISEIAELGAITALAAGWVIDRCKAQQMRIDPAYECFTRSAVEATPPKDGAIFFWDIEGRERWPFLE